jgi:hypothetical protein
MLRCCVYLLLFRVARLMSILNLWWPYIVCLNVRARSMSRCSFLCSALCLRLRSCLQCDLTRQCYVCCFLLYVWFIFNFSNNGEASEVQAKVGEEEE